MRTRSINVVLLAVVLILTLLSIYSGSWLLGISLTVLMIFYTFIFPKYSLVYISIFIAIRPFLIALNPSLKGLLDAWVLGLFCLFLWGLNQSGEWRRILPRHLFEWLYLAFCLIGAGAGLFNAVPVQSILFQLHAFLIPYFVFYTVSRLKTFREWSLARYLWLFTAIGALLTPQALVEKISRRQLGLPAVWQHRLLTPDNARRVYSLMDNPNTLAYFLGFAIVCAGLLLELRRTSKIKANRIVLYLSLILMISVFFLTQSRGAIISYGVAVAVITFLNRVIRLPIRLVLAGMFAIFFIILPIQLLSPVFDHSGWIVHQRLQSGNGLMNRYESAFDSASITESSESGRLWVVQKGVGIWKEQPIIGTGFGTFGDSASYAFGSPISQSYKLPRLLYSDNQYIEIMVEAGIVGVALIAAFLISLFVHLKKRGHGLRLRGILMGLFFGAVFAGLYYNIWEMLPFTFTFFLFLGIYELEIAEVRSSANRVENGTVRRV